MNPQPKRGKLHYKKYEDWIRKRPCALSPIPTRAILSHRRELCGGGTGIKPPSFHCLPISPLIHDNEHQHGADIERDVIADLCLHEVVKYIKDNASLSEKVEILDMLGAYIVQEGM